MFTTASVIGVVRRILPGLLMTAIATPCLQAQADRSLSRTDNATIAITDGELAAAVRRAVRGATRLLEDPACAGVLDDFTDQQGRPLRAVLASLTLTPPDSLSRMIFRDGWEHPTCRNGGIAAFTGPGSRVVFICGNRFAAIERPRARQVVIHEMLHTLGLGEGPPAPSEIDRAIARRCTA